MQTQKYAAFGGIRNTLSNERIDRAVRQVGSRDQRTDLVEADNVDLDSSGRASRRAGQTLVIPTAAHSIWASNDMCLFVQAGVLMRLNADYTATQLASGIGDSPMCYEDVNDTIYWSNGVMNGVVTVEGIAQTWGMYAPEYQPQAVGIAGTLAAGTYLFAMTYMRNDGQESGTGLAGQIQLADNSGLRFTWAPPSDRSITSVAVYLSEPNSEVMYQAFVAPVSAGAASFTGGALSLPLNTQWLDAPPAGDVLTWHRGRIFIAKGAFLYATAALGYGYVDLRDYVAIDNTLIRFAIAVDHGVYVGTELAVYFLKGDALTEMTLDSVTESYGVAGSAILVDGFVATGDEKLAGSICAMFASGSGVHLGTPDGTVTNLTYDRFQITMPRSGAAVLRTSQTLTQYLLTMHD